MKRFISISIIILLLGIIGYFAYNAFMRWHREEIESAKMEAREEMKEVQRPVIPEEKLSEVLGEIPKDIAGEEKQKSFEDVERQVMAFFSYLDKQDYVTAYKLEGGTYHQFQQIVETLSANPPLVTGETQSLYTLSKNMSHFFRFMGRKRLNLVKEILMNEAEVIESVMETFYLWFTMNNNAKERINKDPSLKILYEYSGYFLNTLAGRSYLLRRDPKVRILTMHYSVLILDKANDAFLNSNGIDIRPYIKLLLNDIGNQNVLIDKEQYISELERLEKKYQL